MCSGEEAEVIDEKSLFCKVFKQVNVLVMSLG